MIKLAAIVAVVVLAYGNLPDDWTIAPPPSTTTGTDTLPQFAAASPNGRILAVLCAGYNTPTLRLYRTSDLSQVASIALGGAFGRPVWIGDDRVLVAGANTDAILDVDVTHQAVRAIPVGKGTYPSAIARAGDRIAVGTDGDLSVRLGSLDGIARAKPVKIGGYVGGLAFSAGGRTLFASNRSGSFVDAIDAATLDSKKIRTGLHPADVMVVDDALYVAESDADTVGIYDATRGKPIASVFVGDVAGGTRLAGVSPNALERSGSTVYVSLGAANSVAILHGSRVVGRIAAGRYPTDAVPVGDTLFIVDGKGEGQPANPYFRGQRNGYFYYNPALEFGSVRAHDLRLRPDGGNPQGARGWGVRSNSIVRNGGPIRHVFFILKENRSYDEILGDVRGGNGNAKLAWFGGRVTPNEHALAARFGLFDNTYASGEVSEAGHDWSDAAFVDDYVQRLWPSNYADRGNGDDTVAALESMVPRNGYIWQDARASGVTFRDYGEQTNVPETGLPTLKGLYDPRYRSFDLAYSDVNRVKEWRREFDSFLRAGTLPQLEYIWLPNDHTAASKPGLPTPAAYVAQNDYATGLIVDAISHSPVWKSSAIFVIEDDAQDGPDHAGVQRTTFFAVSPYSRGGFRHEHYSTVSVLRTMELLLGMPPLSTYDAMAVPLYAAFTSKADFRPFEAIPPKVSLTKKNVASAYGAKVSAKLNFTRPDANPPALLNDIIAHNRSI